MHHVTSSVPEKCSSVKNAVILLKHVADAFLWRELRSCTMFLINATHGVSSTRVRAGDGHPEVGMVADLLTG